MSATNGTPSISEHYGILGEPRRAIHGNRSLSDVSLVVLPRGPALFRPALLAEYWAVGFAEVIAVESSPLVYDAAALVEALPGLRVLVESQPQTTGGQINTAAREVSRERFLVLWDDQRLIEAGSPARLPKLSSGEVAAVPVLRDAGGRLLPSVHVPGFTAGQLKVLSLATDEEKVDTLFPGDFTALYHRQQFLGTGGFDVSLTSPYWQVLDWGFRCHLWGETLELHRSFSVEYRLVAPSADKTADRNSHSVYLRNLAVRHEKDHGLLPWSRFWRFRRRSGQSLLDSLLTFSRHRQWVHRHRYRFKTDARLLTELWGTA